MPVLRRGKVVTAGVSMYFGERPSPGADYSRSAGASIVAAPWGRALSDRFKMRLKIFENKCGLFVFL